jgi:D-psicose/D-tagatose/L-ribulose 3-epimerase
VNDHRTTNPLGVHALVWTGRNDPDALRDAARRSADAGFELLELSLHTLVGLQPATTREDIAAAGLQVVASRGLAPDADVSSADPAVVDRGVDLLQRSVQAIADLGGHVLTGALYSAFGKYPHPVSAAGRANAVAALRELAPYAAERGVTLGLEICNRYETNVINTAHDALVLADDIGADNIMIHLDSYHMNIEEDDFVRPVREVGDRLGYVHIGENHRGYLGSGHIDFAALFHALVDIGYRGPLTFESFSSAVVAEPLSSDLAIWRDLWEDSADLAAHARRFMADGLAAAGAR